MYNVLDMKEKGPLVKFCRMLFCQNVFRDESPTYVFIEIPDIKKEKKAVKELDHLIKYTFLCMEMLQFRCQSGRKVI